MNCQINNIRKAFTLLELLLVLAILVALAGIAVPTFESMVTSRKLGESIQQLMNELKAARVAAMRTGQAQVMRATLQTRDYSISPWLGGTESQDASAGATVMGTDGQVVATEKGASGGVSTSAVDASSGLKQLSSGVQFSAIETLVDSRNALELQNSGEVMPTAGAAVTTDGLSSPLLVYPDGSTTTAQIVLVDQSGRRMAIQIRGVTGQLSSFRLMSVDPSSIAK
jgi:prepilin-type N-terminal cleavage/methylation domain-containing protein